METRERKYNYWRGFGVASIIWVAIFVIVIDLILSKII